MDTLILANAMLFLSTLSLRRATNARLEIRRPYAISIHALLAESDPSGSKYSGCSAHFYPRSPCGERLTLQDIEYFPALFLSTLSLRRATADKHVQPPTRLISIHALLAESDRRPGQTAKANRDFYPRSPCGERRQ